MTNPPYITAGPKKTITLHIPLEQDERIAVGNQVDVYPGLRTSPPLRNLAYWGHGNARYMPLGADRMYANTWAAINSAYGRHTTLRNYV